jgi:hypothetical protein
MDFQTLQSLNMLEIILIKRVSHDYVCGPFRFIISDTVFPLDFIIGFFIFTRKHIES